jgi:hypothetical protein
MEQKTNQTAVWREWIEKCIEDRSRLTKWEEDFVESIGEQLDERGTLSERQADILERIYSGKTR